MKRAVDRVLNPPGALNTFRGRAIALLVVLLLLVGGAGGAYYLLADSRPTFRRPASLSQGTIAYDTSVADHKLTASDPKTWATYKKQASIDLKNGNTDHAPTEYAAATTQRPDRRRVVDLPGEYTGRQPADNAVLHRRGRLVQRRQRLDRPRRSCKASTRRSRRSTAAAAINGHPIALLLANDASTSRRRDPVGAQGCGARATSWPWLATAPARARRWPCRSCLPRKIPLITPTASKPNPERQPLLLPRLPQRHVPGDAGSAVYAADSCSRAKSQSADRRCGRPERQLQQRAEWDRQRGCAEPGARTPSRRPTRPG